MMVRFATTCDRCQVRAREYTAWPHCRECMDDVCLECAVPGSLQTGDGDGPDTVLCGACQQLDLLESA